MIMETPCWELHQLIQQWRGGRLSNLLVWGAPRKKIRHQSRNWPSEINSIDRQVIGVEKNGKIMKYTLSLSREGILLQSLHTFKNSIQE